MFRYIMASPNPKNWKIGKKIRQNLDFFNNSRIVYRLKANGEGITYLTKRIKYIYILHLWIRDNPQKKGLKIGDLVENSVKNGIS